MSDQFEHGELSPNPRRRLRDHVADGFSWLHRLATDSTVQRDENPNAYEYAPLTPRAKRRKAKAATRLAETMRANPDRFTVLFESQDTDGTLNNLEPGELATLHQLALNPAYSAEPESEIWENVVTEPLDDDAAAFRIIFYSAMQSSGREKLDVLFSATATMTSWLEVIGAEHVNISYVSLQQTTYGEPVPDPEGVFADYTMIADHIESARNLPTTIDR